MDLCARGACFHMLKDQLIVDSRELHPSGGLFERVEFLE